MKIWKKGGQKWKKRRSLNCEARQRKGRKSTFGQVVRTRRLTADSSWLLYRGKLRNSLPRERLWHGLAGKKRNMSVYENVCVRVPSRLAAEKEKEEKDVKRQKGETPKGRNRERKRKRKIGDQSAINRSAIEIHRSDSISEYRESLDKARLIKLKRFSIDENTFATKKNQAKNEMRKGGKKERRKETREKERWKKRG